MKAVILAAGRGSRLGDLTDIAPKGMVKIAGQPLLEWQRRALMAAGVEDVTVVTGYRSDVICDFGFSTIHNSEWAQGNMISSLVRAFEKLDGPLIVGYADILYEPAAVRALMACPGPLALTYDPDWLTLWRRRFDDPLSDAETFRLDEAGRLLEIGAAAASTEDIKGQFMGLLKVDPVGREWIGAFLEENPEARLRFDTTKLLSHLIAAGLSITAVPSVGVWCEVDTQRDLAVAEALVAEGALTLISDGEPTP
jgi:L-glutamine-phosphate cytidylyltransferase